MIYLARHGETEFNVIRRLQGQCDSPLTSRGRDQARRMGLTLGGLIDPAEAMVFSSPLGRARQTAEIIAAAAAISSDIVFDADLMEIFYAHMLADYVGAVLVPLGALIALASIHWLVALAVLPFAPLLASVPLWLARRADAQGRRLSVALGALNADVVEGIQGQRELAIFGHAPAYLRRLMGRTETVVDADLQGLDQREGEVVRDRRLPPARRGGDQHGDAKYPEAGHQYGGGAARDCMTDQPGAGRECRDGGGLRRHPGDDGEDQHGLARGDERDQAAQSRGRYGDVGHAASPCAKTSLA